jgi:hypothetical protein
MKLKAVKPTKDHARAGARARPARPQNRGARGQDLGDRRLQLLLGAKAGAR